MKRITKFFIVHERKFQIAWCIYLMLLLLCTTIISIPFVFGSVDIIVEATRETVEDSWEPTLKDITTVVYAAALILCTVFINKDLDKALNKLKIK